MTLADGLFMNRSPPSSILLCRESFSLTKILACSAGWAFPQRKYCLPHRSAYSELSNYTMWCLIVVAVFPHVSRNSFIQNFSTEDFYLNVACDRVVSLLACNHLTVPNCSSSITSFQKLREAIVSLLQ